MFAGRSQKTIRKREASHSACLIAGDLNGTRTGTFHRGFNCRNIDLTINQIESDCSVAADPAFLFLFNRLQFVEVHAARAGKAESNPADLIGNPVATVFPSTTAIS